MANVLNRTVGWHYWWQVKKGPDDAIYYAAIFAVLIGLRVYWYLQKRNKRQHKKSPA